MDETGNRLDSCLLSPLPCNSEVKEPDSNAAYYAANAPEKPDWFTPKPLSEPSNPSPDPSTLPSGDQAAGTAYLNDGTIPSSPSAELQAFMVKVDHYKGVQIQYANANAAEAFFQWRWHYAKMMVARESQ